MQTLCPFCATGCGMRLEVAGGRIRSVRSDKNHPVSHGRLCIKGARIKEIVHADDRLRRPLLRKGSDLQPVGWPEALDWLSEKIERTVKEYGGEALASFKGHIPGPDVLDPFAQLWGLLDAPNATGATHLCHIPSYLGFHFVYGLQHYPVGAAVPDYERTRCAVVWGGNPSKGTRISAATLSIPKLRKNGGKLVVIDPYRTAVAESADIWLPVDPGTDLALGLALLSEIVRLGLYDADFIFEWTTGFEEMKHRVMSYTPQWAAGQTGVPADRIEAAARMMAETKPMAIDFGNGIDMHPNVADTARVIAMLMALTGNLDRPGGNHFLSGAPVSPYPTVRSQKKPLGVSAYPYFPLAVFPEAMDALLEERDTAPRGMLVYHGNPLLSCADENRVRAFLAKLDWLAVSELFMTATAEMADLVLPDASPFERYGFKPYSTAKGGYIGVRRPVIEPVGEARPWYDVEYELARRLGLEDRYPWQTGQEWLAQRIAPCGRSLSDFESQNPIQITPPAADYQYREKGFKTPSGKVEFCSERFKEMGLASFPGWDPPPESRERRPEAAEQYPLIGTTRKPAPYIHTRYRNIPPLRRKEPFAWLHIHPDDAAARGIGDGKPVRVFSDKGEVRLTAKVTDRIRAGMVVADFGWGNPGDGGDNINRLTADQHRDPVSCATPNRRFLCQVAPA